MRINTMKLLMLPLLLIVTAAMDGCARTDGIPPATEEVQPAPAARPVAPGTYVYVSPKFRISYQGLSLLDDGTAVVFVNYSNLSDESEFEFLVDDGSTIDGHSPESNHVLLNESGARYRLVHAGQLQDPAGLRLLPRGSVRAAFTFRLEGSRQPWAFLCGRRAAPEGLFHLIGGQRVRELSAGGSRDEEPAWGLSLVIDNMAP